jgi:hypothetical protein
LSAAWQLRRYQVKDGEIDTFVKLWREEVVPAREAYGFRVESAWTGTDGREFGWIVSHPDASQFEVAEKAYYASPERAAISTDPASFLDEAKTWMVDPVDRR